MPKQRKENPSLTAGQLKLKSFGLDLPLFPVTTVGSLPKNHELKELRYKVEHGVQSPQELERKERLATEVWIHEQERLGLDILVDGEISRSDMITDFAKHINGFFPGGTVRVYGNRYYRKPIIREKLNLQGPFLAEKWAHIQRMTKKPLKAIMTGPYTLMDWSFNEYYSSREDTVEDLTKIMKKEVQALIQAGAKIIQIDEPALASHPEEFPLLSNAIKELTSGHNAYFILHHSYGDLTALWKKIIRLPVDNIDLELTSSGSSLLSVIKKNPTKKDISVGIIDSHTHHIDTPRQVGDHIRTCLKSIPAKQIWFSPDCGLKTRSAEEAIGKLKVMVNTVSKFRKQHQP